MKFAIKVHNKYLSEAVQKLAFDNDYKKTGTTIDEDPILIFSEQSFTWCGGDDYSELYNDRPLFDALTDWQKIEQAMKPKVPRVIWVYECEKYDPNPVILSEEVAKSKVEKGCITCKATKFQEVIE